MLFGLGKRLVLTTLEFFQPCRPSSTYRPTSCEGRRKQRHY